MGRSTEPSSFFPGASKRSLLSTALAWANVRSWCRPRQEAGLNTRIAAPIGSHLLRRARPAGKTAWPTAGRTGQPGSAIRPDARARSPSCPITGHRKWLVIVLGTTRSLSPRNARIHPLMWPVDCRVPQFPDGGGGIRCVVIMDIGCVVITDVVRYEMSSCPGRGRSQGARHQPLLVAALRPGSGRDLLSRLMEGGLRNPIERSACY